MTKSYLTIISAVCLLVVFSLLMTGCDKKIANTTPDTNIKTEENTKTPDSADKTPEKADADLTAEPTGKETVTTPETSDKIQFPEYNVNDIVWAKKDFMNDDQNHSEIGASNYWLIKKEIDSGGHKEYFPGYSGREWPENPVFSILILALGSEQEQELLPDDKIYSPQGIIKADEKLGIANLEKHLDELCIPHIRVNVDGTKGVDVIVTYEQLDLLKFKDTGLWMYVGLEILEYKDGIITVPEEFRWE